MIIVNENYRRYRVLECIREGIKDMFEKYLELGVKVRVMSYCGCYISGVMKVYRYIYCNRRERFKWLDWEFDMRVFLLEVLLLSYLDYG